MSEVKDSSSTFWVNSAATAKQWSTGAYELLLNQSWITRRVDRFSMKSATLIECKASFDVDTLKIQEILSAGRETDFKGRDILVPIMKRPKGIMFEVDCRDFDGRAVSIASVDISSWFAVAAFLGAVQSPSTGNSSVSAEMATDIYRIIRGYIDWNGGDLSWLKKSHETHCPCGDCEFVDCLKSQDIREFLKMLQNDSLILVPLTLSGKNEILKLRDVGWLHQGTGGGLKSLVQSERFTIQVISNPTLGRHHIQFIAPEGGQIVSEEIVTDAFRSDGPLPGGLTAEVISGFDQCAIKFSEESHFQKEDEFFVLFRVMPKATLFYLTPLFAFFSSLLILGLILFYLFIEYDAIDFHPTNGWPAVDVDKIKGPNRGDIVSSPPFAIIFATLISLVAVRTGEHAIVSGQILSLRLLLILLTLFMFTLLLTLTMSQNGRGIFLSMAFSLVVSLIGFIYCILKVLRILSYRHTVSKSGGQSQKKSIIFIPHQ